MKKPSTSKTQKTSCSSPSQNPTNEKQGSMDSLKKSIQNEKIRLMSEFYGVDFDSLPLAR